MEAIRVTADPLSIQCICFVSMETTGQCSVSTAVNQVQNSCSLRGGRKAGQSYSNEKQESNTNSTSIVSRSQASTPWLANSHIAREYAHPALNLPSFCFLHWNSSTTSSCPTKVWTGVFKSKTFQRRRLFSRRSWGTITVTSPLLKGLREKHPSS